MPKFLIQATYSVEGAKGLQGEGGSSRREAVSSAISGLGGTLESFHFAFGDHDVYVIADMPDNEAAASVAMTVNSAGAATVKTVVLLTPEQVDEAVKRSVDYRPAGG